MLGLRKSGWHRVLSDFACATAASKKGLSKSGDFDGDREVDFKDFAAISSAWLTEQGDAEWNLRCDMAPPPNELIDMSDLAVFAGYWLVEYK